VRVCAVARRAAYLLRKDGVDKRQQASSLSEVSDIRELREGDAFHSEVLGLDLLLRGLELLRQLLGVQRLQCRALVHDERECGESEQAH
jgi:hypothetical protein